MMEHLKTYEIRENIRKNYLPTHNHAPRQFVFISLAENWIRVWKFAKISETLVSQTQTRASSICGYFVNRKLKLGLQFANIGRKHGEKLICQTQ